MKTVGQIFEPRIERIGTGSFIKSPSGIIYIIGHNQTSVVERNRVGIVNVMTGANTGTANVTDTKHFTESEVLQLLGDTYREWEAMTPREALSELAATA